MSLTLWIIIGLVIFILFGKNIKKMTSSVGSSISGNLLHLAIYVGAYASILAIVYFKLPSFWKAWMNPFGFFLASNLAILAGILIITIPKKSGLGWTIIAFSILAILIFNVRDIVKENQNDNKEQVSDSGFSGTKENASWNGKKIILMDHSVIQPGEIWITERISYNFIFHSLENVPIKVRFTSKNGGYTEPIIYQAGEETFDLPYGATQGPAEVSLPGINYPAEVGLYKLK